MKKTHAAINNKLFNRLAHINDQLCEVELVKSQIEHTEPITLGFFSILQARMKTFELYYNFFFKKLCNTDKEEEMEIDTGSLYSALAETFSTSVSKEKENKSGNCCEADCNDTSTADACCKFFAHTCCAKRKKHDKREPGLFKEEFR